jgi:hypothetical protein
MRPIRIALLALLAALALDAHAGMRTLTVAFFDYTDHGVGKASFKALRASGYTHSCWDNLGEVHGIDTAYIENPPKSLDRNLLLAATRGSLPAAKAFAAALIAGGMDNAYAFVPDPTGTYVTLYGIDGHSGAVAAAASFYKPEKGVVDRALLSKAFCQATQPLL